MASATAFRPVPGLVLLLLTTTLATACGRIDMSADERTGAASHVLEGDAFSGSATLLAAMRGRVGSMQVQTSGRCPEISLRGERTLQGPSNPLVYVDGVATTDTCPLVELAPNDIRRIEVYPHGRIARPGYRPHPYGLILIYTRND